MVTEADVHSAALDEETLEFIEGSEALLHVRGILASRAGVCGCDKPEEWRDGNGNVLWCCAAREICEPDGGTKMDRNTFLWLIEMAKSGSGFRFFVYYQPPLCSLQCSGGRIELLVSTRLEIVYDAMCAHIGTIADRDHTRCRACEWHSQQKPKGTANGNT